MTENERAATVKVYLEAARNSFCEAIYLAVTEEEFSTQDVVKILDLYKKIGELSRELGY